MKLLRAKYLKIVLLMAALMVWVTVGYRILKNSEESEVEPTFAFNSTAIRAVESKRPELMLNYGDPFLDNLLIEEESQEFELPVQPVVVIWPQVQYNGIIKKNKAYLGLVTINGQPCFLELGKANAGVKLMKMYRDSVVLRFEGENKVFYLR